MINITYGRTFGDATNEYIISFSEGMTVGEFIEEWMKDKREWGYFGIYDGKTIFGNPQCEYSHGELVTAPFPENVLKKKILKAAGSGGWSRSDFLFEI